MEYTQFTPEQISKALDAAKIIGFIQKSCGEKSVEIIEATELLREDLDVYEKIRPDMKFRESSTRPYLSPVIDRDMLKRTVKSIDDADKNVKLMFDIFNGRTKNEVIFFMFLYISNRVGEIEDGKTLGFFKHCLRELGSLPFGMINGSAIKYTGK